MKRLIGKLPVNVKYQIIDISYKSKDDNNYCVCDNCNKITSNIATIKNKSGNVYNVGMDCASTIQLYQNNEIFNIIEAKKILARRARFTKWVKTHKISALRQDNMVYMYDYPATQWESNYRYKMPYDYLLKTYPGLNIPVTIIQS